MKVVDKTYCEEVLIVTTNREFMHDLLEWLSDQGDEDRSDVIVDVRQVGPEDKRLTFPVSKDAQ